MFIRLLKESFKRNPRRKLLTGLALVLGMTVATATFTVAVDVGDQLAREFRSLGANLLVTPKADTLPVEIGGVDYRPAGSGAYLSVSDLPKLKMIFWRHNILGFTPFLDVPVRMAVMRKRENSAARPTANSAAADATLIGTWYKHAVPLEQGGVFVTGASLTHPWWKIHGRWFDEAPTNSQAGDLTNHFRQGTASAVPNGLRNSGVLTPEAARLQQNTHDIASRNAAVTSDNSPGECVLGVFFAERNHIAIGDLLQISSGTRSISAKVTGIVTTGGAEDNAILCPLGMVQTLAGEPDKFRQLFVSALTKPDDAFAHQDPNKMTPTEFDRWYCSPYIGSISRQIQEALPGTEVRTIRRVAETEGRVLSRVSLLLWMITIAALVAAALAVGATSATTAIERRAEVGLMKALGATNFFVGGLFLSEQVLLALAGGCLGFAFGIGLAHEFGETVFGVSLSPHAIVFPVILATAAFVAILGSWIPLYRAAHVRPAPILRAE